MRPADRRLGLLIAIVLALLALAPAASAAKPAGERTAAKHRDSSKATQTESEPPPQLTEPGQVSASDLAKDLGGAGQVDPISGLGIRNPVCDEVGQIRSRSVRLSCEGDGSPESAYPTSNYGFDTFITTGITHPIGDFTAAFVTVLNGIWLGLIFVLKLIFELLGLAFSLNPFSEGQTMSRISAALGRLYAEITDPWLSCLVVCGGVWFAYRGLIRRDLAGGVGGTLAAIAMVVLGLWVVHQPGESVGRLAGLSDEVALATISAPQSGSLGRPVGTYAETMAATWSRLVEVPFAGLDFSDVNWALSPPPPEAVKRANAAFCQDVGALAVLAFSSEFGSTSAQEACGAFARKRYGRPRRVIDLYLRSSPGSPSRETLWNYFNGEERYKDKVAAQGGEGALTRLSMLALFALGLLGAILLLAWLAIRLFSQAAIAFFCLLAAPFALFFPLLGETGRRAFKTWGLTLTGALLAKVIYAAFLSIVLLGIEILGRVDGSGGSATGFLLSAAFTWAVFLKRGDLIGLVRVGEPERGAHAGFGAGALAALTVPKLISRRAGQSAQGLARRGAQWRRERSVLGAEATRQTAKGSLSESGRALADQRHAEAQRVIAAFESKHSPASEASEVAAKPAASARSKAPSPRRPSPTPGREAYQRARGLVDRAEQNERRLGRRWSEADLTRFAAEDRQLLQRSRDPVEHAHRAGYGRAQFESLRGPERERAEAEIEKARRRDLQRIEIASRPPGRIAGRGRLLAERVRQGAEGAGAERRAQLAELRRDRRPDQLSASRRNLSRGA